MSLFNKIPIRITILILIFVLRFLAVCVNYHLRYSFRFMILRKDSIRYKPWCYLSSSEKTDRDVKIPWYNISSPDYGPRYNWPIEATYYFNDAVFFGQMATCVPGGIVAEYVGPYYVLLYCTGAIAILNQLRLTFTEINLTTLVVSEFILGCHFGFIYPATIAWIARWAPPNERGIFAATVMGDGIGAALEAIFLTLMAPTIGYRGTFYVLTSAIVLYFILLFFLGSNFPEDHRLITANELYYIKKSQRGRVTSTKSFPPLGKIMISRAYWMVNLYLYDFMGIGRQIVEYLKIFPSLGFSVVASLSGLLADFLRSKNIGDETVVVRAFAVFSHLIPGCTLMVMGLVYCDETSAIILMIVGYAFNGSYVISVYRTVVDITPNYAGTMYGLTLVFSSLVKLIVPRVRESVIFPINNGVIGWTIMFLIGGGCTVGTGIIFMFFGSCEGERWNLKSQDEFRIFYYKKPEEAETASPGPSTVSNGNIKEAKV